MYSLFRSLGVASHGAQLVDAESATPGPDTRLPEEDGATRIELDRERCEQEQRHEQDDCRRSETRIHRALRAACGPGEPERRQADEGDAFHGMDLRRRTDEFEQPGHDVDLQVERLEEADQVEQLVVRVLGEGDDDALDAVAPDDVRQARRRAEQRQAADLRRPLARHGVDEADQVDAVLAVLEELARDHLADASRSDDDGVLEVGRSAAAEGAGRGASDRHDRDREGPEGDQSRKGRRRERGSPRQPRRTPRPRA